MGPRYMTIGIGSHLWPKNTPTTGCITIILFSQGKHLIYPSIRLIILVIRINISVGPIISFITNNFGGSQISI